MATTLRRSIRAFGVVITAGKPQTLVHIDCVVGASLPALLERHFTNVTNRVRESDCRPLEFAADDLHPLSRYGVAAQMRATAVPLLWLGNPYAGRELPPASRHDLRTGWRQRAGIGGRR